MSHAKKIGEANGNGRRTLREILALSDPREKRRLQKALMLEAEEAVKRDFAPETLCRAIRKAGGDPEDIEETLRGYTFGIMFSALFKPEEGPIHRAMEEVRRDFSKTYPGIALADMLAKNFPNDPYARQFEDAFVRQLETPEMRKFITYAVEGKDVGRSYMVN